MPLRRHLVALVLGTLVPMLVLATALLAWNTQTQRRAAEDILLGTTRALALAFEQEMQGTVTALESAALGSGLRGEGPGRLHLILDALWSRHPHWQSVFMVDAEGEWIGDAGFTPPPAAQPRRDSLLKQAVATGRPTVSGLVRSQDGVAPVVIITVPILIEDEPRFGLGVVAEASHWSRLLRRQQVPEGWIGMITDQGDQILARAHDPEIHVGRSAPLWLMEGTHGMDEGVLQGKALDGQAITIGFHRLPLSGWSLGFAVPSNLLALPLQRTLCLAAAIGSACIALAITLAVFFGRRVAEPMRALTRTAAALEENRVPPPTTLSPVMEINDLRTAFEVAGVRLREQTAERERLLGEEARRRREAELAIAAKSQFLASASHDLRQPMQSLFLLTDALADRLGQPHPAYPLVTSQKLALDAMKGLLDGLLDLSKLDAGIITPEVAEFPVAVLMERLSAACAPRFTAKGLRLRVVGSTAWLRSDRALLERILGNLLENALKYTETGGVVIGARRCADWLRLDVVDTGIGIAPERLDDIFEEFVQIGNPARDRTQGLGLGLAIVRRLALLLDHGLSVRSVPGRGSCFSILVPLAPQRPAAIPSAPPAPGPADEGVILLIEDEPLIRMGMQILLEDWGYQVIAAASADAAIQRIEAASRPPAAIVADYRLGKGRTGIEALRAIHALCGSVIPSILLTGDTGPERLAEAERAGFALLHKPVAPPELRALLGRLRRG